MPLSTSISDGDFLIGRYPRAPPGPPTYANSSLYNNRAPALNPGSTAPPTTRPSPLHSSSASTTAAPHSTMAVASLGQAGSAPGDGAIIAPSPEPASQVMPLSPATASTSLGPAPGPSSSSQQPSRLGRPPAPATASYQAPILPPPPPTPSHLAMQPGYAEPLLSTPPAAGSQGGLLQPQPGYTLAVAPSPGDGASASPQPASASASSPLAPEPAAHDLPHAAPAPAPGGSSPPPEDPQNLTYFEAAASLSRSASQMMSGLQQQGASLAASAAATAGGPQKLVEQLRKRLEITESENQQLEELLHASEKQAERQSVAAAQLASELQALQVRGGAYGTAGGAGEGEGARFPWGGGGRRVGVLCG